MAYAARKTNLKQAVHIILFMTILATVTYALSSLADNPSAQISKERLDIFYNTSTEVQFAGKEAAVEFFEKHLHKEFEGVMYVSSRLESAPLQKETIVLTKFEYLRDIKKAYEISKFDEIVNGIISFDIADDGRSANIKDRTYTVASVPQEKSEGYNLRQFINCDKLYVLNDKDILQLKSSTCQVEGHMSKAHAL